MFEAQLAEFVAAGGCSIEVVDAEGFEDGTVGWGATRCRAELGTNGEFALRVTAVFRLEQGHWRVVQMHFSAGVATEVASGMDLASTFEAVADAVRTDRPDFGVPPAPDGTVTLMFTDIEASTTIAERLGDEQWTRLLRWLRDTTTAAAQAHRGYVVKCLGDGFMIAFPSASEGLACAKQLQRDVAAGWHGETIRLRAGLHAGDAVRDVDDFYGHAVTVAARVAALAQGRETLATRVVRELARVGEFQFAEPRIVQLKGLEGHYEVVAVAP